MKNEKKKKKGLLSAFRESLAKTGGCCGSGETCGGTANEDDKRAAEKKNAEKSDS